MSKTIGLDAAITAIMGEPSEARYPAYYAEKLKKLPAVPQEMSAREFLRQHHRLCHSGMSCEDCPITHDPEVPCSCEILMGIDPDETVAIVEQWAKEHPEKKRKTYAEDFFEKFPKGVKRVGDESIPLACRYQITGDRRCNKDGCVACWNEEMEEQDE